MTATREGDEMTALLEVLLASPDTASTVRRLVAALTSPRPIDPLTVVWLTELMATVGIQGDQLTGLVDRLTEGGKVQ